MANPNLNTDKEFLSPADKEFENNIRPSNIEDFSGQQQIIDNLKIFIKVTIISLSNQINKINGTNSIYYKIHT